MESEAKSEGLAFIVDDDRVTQKVVAASLEDAGFDTECFSDAASTLAEARRRSPDVYFLDLSLPDMNGLQLLGRLALIDPGTPSVIITGEDDTDVIVTSIQLGAHDYLVKPLSPDRLSEAARSAVSKGRPRRRSRGDRSPSDCGFLGMLGSSPVMLDLYRQVEQVASKDLPALVQGESGTGKELIAQAIHSESPRSNGPFVALNCSAIPETLQEDELFGHEKGAFTGATSDRKGCFERADGGTLFLDEVGELSAHLQAKLLRVLQERTFMRVGGVKERTSDFRLVCATHRNLLDEVEEGRFRLDLYYRIAVFELRSPALRERVEDIPALAVHFVKEMSDAYGTRVLRFSEAALDLLIEHSWPGNVRELRNAVQRAVAVSESGCIEPADLPVQITGAGPRAPGAPPSPGRSGTLPTLDLKELEETAVRTAFRKTKGNPTQTAKVLGIGRTTLYRKLHKYGLI